MDEQTRDHGTIGETRFEATLKLLAGATSRRAALRALAASAFGGAMAPLLGVGDGEEADAKRRQRRHAKAQQRHGKSKQRRERKRARARAQKQEDKCAKAGQQPKDGKPCCPGLIEDVSGRCAPPTGACTVCASGCLHSTVQAAVTAAAPDATITICAGTYTENVRIEQNLTLIGVGDGADPASNTILHGVGGSEGGEAAVIVEPGFTVSLQNLRLTGGDSARGIINEGDLSVSGCTVSDSTIPAGLVGGGIHNAGTLTLDNCTVSHNTADSAAGIFNLNEKSLTLTDCIVSDNHATANGGGIVNAFGGSLTLTDTTVRNNTADQGGGIDNAGTVTVSGGDVTGNVATHSGGGISSVVVGSSLTITNTPISDNMAVDGAGGGIVSTIGTLELNGVELSGNRARLGGAIDCQGGMLTDTTVRSNTATNIGGGIRNEGGTLTLAGTSSVTLNHAAFSSGGIDNLGMVNCSAQGMVSDNTAGDPPVASDCIDVGGSGCDGCNPPA